MILSEEQIESYHKNGFLLLDNFLSQSELKRFEDVLKKIIKIQLNKAQVKHPELNIDFDGNEFDNAIIKLEQTDHQYIADIYDTIYSTSAFISLAAKKRFQNVLIKFSKEN